MGSSMAKKKRGRSIKTQLFLSFSPPSSPPSQSHLAHVRRPFNVRHAGVGKGTGNQRKGSEKEGRRSVVCFFFFFLIFHLALSSPRPSEKVEQVSFSPSLSPPPLSLSVSHFALSFQNQLLAAPLQSAAPSPARASPRRRATLRHLPSDNAGCSLRRPAGAARGLRALAVCAG